MQLILEKCNINHDILMFVYDDRLQTLITIQITQIFEETKHELSIVYKLKKIAAFEQNVCINITTVLVNG